MITPEEMARFEQIFEQMKYLILSDTEDKYKKVMSHVVKLVYIKNEGNQYKTATELGVTPRTVRKYLKDFKIDSELLCLHLNMLTTSGWFTSLSQIEQGEQVSMVMDYYRDDLTRFTDFSSFLGDYGYDEISLDIRSEEAI